jgi:hypothetical protein
MSHRTRNGLLEAACLGIALFAGWSIGSIIALTLPRTQTLGKFCR